MLACIKISYKYHILLDVRWYLSRICFRRWKGDCEKFLQQRIPINPRLPLPPLGLVSIFLVDLILRAFLGLYVTETCEKRKVRLADGNPIFPRLLRPQPHKSPPSTFNWAGTLSWCILLSMAAAQTSAPKAETLPIAASGFRIFRRYKLAEPNLGDNTETGSRWYEQAAVDSELLSSRNPLKTRFSSPLWLFSYDSSRWPHLPR